MSAVTPPLEVGELAVEDYPDVDRHLCQLLGPTALVVQALMGVLVIFSLVYKRHREKPKRQWRIWMFDVSKQVVGQMFVHGINILMSRIVARHSSSNPCVPYFLNILLDTTLGVGILYLILNVLTFVLIDKLNLKGFESGKYGSPPSLFYWARQATVYVLSLITMKLAVFALFAVFPGIFVIGEWLLSWTWTGKGEYLQVIFTMGLFPIAMNILQFWLIDTIVKASGAVALPTDSARNSFNDQEHEPLFEAPSDDDDDSGGRPRHDIENPRPPSHTSSRFDTPDKPHRTSQSTPVENKSAGSGLSGVMADATAMHSYPPSIASTSTTPSSSPPNGSSPHRLQKQFRRRPPPPPLHLESTTQPAVNIPADRNANNSRVVDEPSKEWEESWDDSDDWANKVGEEEWTGRRIAEKKDSLNTWAATAVHVGA